MQEKIKIQKGFIPIPLLIGIILSLLTISGITYGAIEYNKTSKIIKEAGQLSKEEKYEEAIGKLNLAQDSLIVEKLSIGKREIDNEINKNKERLEDKNRYEQAVVDINEGNLQEAINSLSELSEDSFYYQKAQTKIEEAKRKMVEGQLSEETIAKNAAEAKAKQEEYQKNLKAQELSDKEVAERMMNADNDRDGLTYREELASGSSDFNTDSDGDGIPDNLDSHPVGGGRLIAQHFEWNYGSQPWTWDYSFPSDRYDYYKNKKRDPHGVTYVTSNDPYIKQIAEMLKQGADKNSYTKSAFAVAFIQSLGFVEDNVIGYNDYPKYPLETLAEQNGDCEDTSYLAAAIIDAMGIDCVLVELPGHMAVAVAYLGSPSGYYYPLSNGRNYYYFETTGENWDLGKMPTEYRNSLATIVKIPFGETTTVSPSYIKPCDYDSVFSAYFDGNNYYTDSQCNNLVYCLSIKGYYVKPPEINLYWDNNCSQVVVPGCSKSTTYSGYFTNGIEYYSESQCIVKARLCRPSSIYYDRYWDGDYNYWDSNCTQKVVSWCTKSIYYPGYFFNSIDGKIYVDYQCTIKK